MPVQQQGDWDINDISAGTQTNDIKVTLDSEAVAISGTVTVDATGQGDVPITLSGEAVALAASDGTDIGDVDVATMPGTAAEAAALPSEFVVVAGDDGTDTHPFQVNAGGDLKVTLDSEAVAITGTVTVDATGQGDVPVTLAGEAVAISGVVSVDDNAGSLTVDNTHLTTLGGAVSGSEMQVDVVAALPAGSNAIGKLAANSGVDIGDVDVTSISAGSNKIGDVGIGTRTSGGGSIFYDNDLDEAAVAVKAGAGQIYAIHAFNTTDAPLFLQIFNVAQGSVTVGTTTPDMQYVIPGNADSDGAGFVLEVPMGIEFDTAITVACSTDNEGNTAPGANACVIDIIYA